MAGDPSKDAATVAAGTGPAETGDASPQANDRSVAAPVSEVATKVSDNGPERSTPTESQPVTDPAAPGGVGSAGESEDDPPASAGAKTAPDGAGGTGPPDGETPDDEAPPPDGNAPAPRRRMARTIAEWVAVVGGALLVALVVKTFLVQAFWIPSPSMRPTLMEGDRVLVNKLADDIDDINRGDVIVFSRPDDGRNDGHPESDINDLIKRVVGLPGEELEARNGVLYVDGQRLDEPYLEADGLTGDMETITIPEGHVFVMGDNRANSQDSRYFGPVPDDHIVGRAFVRIWPLSNLGRL